MTYLGVAAAARVAGRSPYELLAQGVDNVIPLWRDSGGGYYFAETDLAPLPRRTTCVVKGCARRLHVVGLCLCTTHYRRYMTGGDITARVQVEKARRGSTKVHQSGQALKVAPRAEEVEALGMILGEGGAGQTGSITTPWDLARQDRHAQQLGTPEMWQAVADAALERAWDDLLSGAYDRRLKARLARLPRTKPRAVQSPLVGVARG